MESRTKEGREDQALCRKLHAHWKMLWRAPSSYKRLKRYNFKLYNQMVETITLLMPSRLVWWSRWKHFPHPICCWLGLWDFSWKTEDYPLDLSPYDDRRRPLVTCGTQLPWAKFARTNQAFGQSIRMSLFRHLRWWGKDFSEEEVAPNVMVCLISAPTRIYSADGL